MTGHRPWRDIKHKNAPTEEELSAARKRLAPYRAGYPEPMIDSRRLRIANGTASDKDKREIRAEDQVIREWNQEDARDFDAPDGERYRSAFSSDVGDEHVERAPDPSPPPTQPPPKPADARRSVEPPAYRYKPNLERLSRRSFVEEGDRSIVEGMLRHTRPIVEQIRDPLVEKIVFPKADEIEYQYPYQDEAVERIEEALAQIYKGSIPSRHLLTIEEAVDLLNGIIQTQAKKLREYEDAMAIQWEMYGDPAKLQERAENAEIELGRLYHVNRNLEQLLDETRQQLSACNVDLHDSKQHQLGLMCGDLQYKLNEIKKLVEENRNIGLADFLAVDILELLES